MSFKEFLLVFIVAFIAFGFLRRFLYYNALQSFRKAADDLERERSRKQAGSIRVQKKQRDEGEYVDFEEVE